MTGKGLAICRVVRFLPVNLRSSFTLALLTLLCACGVPVVPPAENHMESSVAMSASTPLGPATYDVYREGVVGNGRKSVLFFYASWFPYCAENDAKISSLYASGGVKVPTFRVDYDASSALRLQYSVVTQDTFVVVDGNGNRVQSIVHPDDAELRSLLGLPPVPTPTAR